MGGRSGVRPHESGCPCRAYGTGGARSQQCPPGRPPRPSAPARVGSPAGRLGALGRGAAVVAGRTAHGRRRFGVGARRARLGLGTQRLLARRAVGLTLRPTTLGHFLRPGSALGRPAECSQAAARHRPDALPPATGLAGHGVQPRHRRLRGRAQPTGGQRPRHPGAPGLRCQSVHRRHLQPPAACTRFTARGTCPFATLGSRDRRGAIPGERTRRGVRGRLPHR